MRSPKQGARMSVQDLEKIIEEFESINLIYRKTFTFEARLDLLERVKKLMATIRNFEEKT
jgi:hypothetical protein